MAAFSDRVGCSFDSPARHPKVPWKMKFSMVVPFLWTMVAQLEIDPMTSNTECWQSVDTASLGGFRVGVFGSRWGRRLLKHSLQNRHSTTLPLLFLPYLEVGFLHALDAVVGSVFRMVWRCSCLYADAAATLPSPARALAALLLPQWWLQSWTVFFGQCPGYQTPPGRCQARTAPLGSPSARSHQHSLR